METDKHLHTAVHGFSQTADLYDRARSGYPSRIAGKLFRYLNVQPHSSVVELAAGTGKFTENLAQVTDQLMVIEPLPAMREKLLARLPQVRAFDAIAEAIPLPSGSVDFVFAATSFHWFHAEEACAEIARILKPGGGVGLLWTSWSPNEVPDWYQALRKLILPFESGAPRYKHMKWREPFDQGSDFEMLQFERFDVSRPMTPEAIRDRFLSISYVSALPELVFRALSRELDEILKDYSPNGEPLMMPEEVHIYWTFKKKA